MVRGPLEDDETQDASELEFGSLLRKVAKIDDSPGLAPLPRAGRVIGGKYRIESLIGRGGMGAVFRASHLVSHKPVALKWMLPAASDDYAYRRFVREALAAGRIDHPNVVDVYDIGEEGNCAYLVMELLHGESLRERLKRGPFSVTETLDLLLPALRGVSALHRAGVIHRDLKPDNIFICEGPDRTPREAKVLDFGVSSVRDFDASGPTLTQDNAILGTPAYMSPEQLKRPRDADARSDLYSFAVILYEALTGKPPFSADSYPGLVLAITQDSPQDPLALRPDLPRGLGQIVLSALAKDRDARPADMDSFIVALAPFGSAPPAVAGSSTSRRRSALRVALAFGLLAVVALVGLTARQRSSKAVGTDRSALQLPAADEHTSSRGAPANPNTVAEVPSDPPPLPAASAACDACVAEKCGGPIADCEAEPDCMSWYSELLQGPALVVADSVWRRMHATLWARDHGQPNFASGITLAKCAFVRCAAACGGGRNFSCVGNFDWPAGYPRHISLRFRFMEQESGQPLKGVRIRACAPGSRCDLPLGEATTDALGCAEPRLDFSRLPGLQETTLAEFNGFVLVDAGGPYPPLQLEHSAPLVDLAYSRYYMERRADEHERWRSRGLAPLGSDRVLLQVQPRDCYAWAAIGVTLEVWRVDRSGYKPCTDCVIAYPDRTGAPDPSATEFKITSGEPAWVALAPGPATLVIRDAQSRQLLSAHSLNVRSDYEPLAITYPASRTQLAELPSELLVPPVTR